MIIDRVGRLPLFPDEEARWRGVRRLCRVAGDRLLLFSLVDEHAHFVVSAEGGSVRRLAEAVRASLLRGERVGALGAPYFREVGTRSYLEHLVRYVCTQARHHGLGHDLLWSGSCLADLVGARVLEDFSASRIAALLPRLDDARVRALADVQEFPAFVPGAAVDVPTVVAAGCRAVAANLRGGREPERVAARRVLLHMADALFGELRPMARALGLTERTARRQRSLPLDPRIARAVRCQLVIAAMADLGWLETTEVPGTQERRTFR